MEGDGQGSRDFDTSTSIRLEVNIRENVLRIIISKSHSQRKRQDERLRAHHRRKRW